MQHILIIFIPLLQLFPDPLLPPYLPIFMFSLKKIKSPPQQNKNKSKNETHGIRFVLASNSWVWVLSWTEVINLG